MTDLVKLAAAYNQHIGDTGEENKYLLSFAQLPPAFPCFVVDCNENRSNFNLLPKEQYRMIPVCYMRHVSEHK